MREPLTQAHLAQVSVRIVKVVSELVCQVLVPALMVQLEASASKEEEEEEERSASQDQYPEGPGRGASWYDFDRFLDPAPAEVISAIVESLDTSQETTEAGEKAKCCAACTILKGLAFKMRCSRDEEKEEKGSDVDSLDDFGSCCGFSLKEKLRGICKKRPKDEPPRRENSEVSDGSPLQGSTTSFPMTVSSKEVVKDLSSSSFRDTSQDVLEEFLMKSLLTFSLYCSKTMANPPQPSVDSVASEMLETVVESVNQMCEPPPRKVTFPWRRSENTNVSEDQVASTASRLKACLLETLRKFFKSRKEASDKLLEEEKVEVTDMAGLAKSLLEETERLLRRDESGVQSKEALTGLEELINQDKLITFSKMLSVKLRSMFHQQAPSRSRALDPGRRAWSEPELRLPTRRGVGVVLPTEQVYVFVEEAVRRLLTSLIFPPPSWGMGHVIQVQSAASSAADWAASSEKFEAVIGVFSKLMAHQVMGNLGGASATAGLQQEATEPESKKTATLFFQELPNTIRRNWMTLTKIDV